jgi:hypothetical protein
MVGAGVVELVCGSLVFAWVFETSGRSMAVAITLHASAHLDNTFRASESEVRLRVLRLVVLAIAAGLAAAALARGKVVMSAATHTRASSP